MDDLLRKISTLVRSRVNDVLGDPLRSRRDAPPTGKALDAEVERLRQQIDGAIDHEDQLKEKISKMQQEADLLDIQADEALLAGNEAQARHHVERMQHIRRLIEMAQADLSAHQMAAADLIRRVNLLEAIVVEKRQQVDAPPADLSAPDAEAETPSAESVQRRINSLGNVVRQAQERIARQQADEESPTEAEDAPQSLQQDAPASDADSTDTDDDLEVRRNRLSRR